MIIRRAEDLLDDAFVHSRLVCTFPIGPTAEYARVPIILESPSRERTASRHDAT
jgi:hypothetical protein